VTGRVPDNGRVTEQQTAPPVAPRESGKNKRGRETAGDMVRSLGIVLLIVVAVWFFAQPPKSDEKAGVREIDPSATVERWTTAVPGAPVPEGLPEGWRPTSAYYDAAPDRVRLPHVTPGGRYAEFAASTAPAEEFVPEITGATGATDTVDVDGETWDVWVEDDGSRSLVRAFDDVTVVVGTLRATASLEELTTFAASVTAG
jgi:hypothetical protein